MKTILVFGTFDILHAGHIHFLKTAKTLGDILIVVVAREATVRKVKGRSPVHTEKERAQAIRELRCVDKVILGDDKLNVYKVIKTIRPDVIALGYDQRVFTDKLAEKIQEFGLSTKIVRLKPYKAQRYKSKKILERLG